MVSHTVKSCIQDDPYFNLSHSIIFINIGFQSGIKSIASDKEFFVNHPIKSHARHWEEAGFSVSADFETDQKHFDYACIAFPKNMSEGRYAIAKAISVLKRGGRLLCVAENKAGGTRLKKICDSFGLSDISVVSKNKSKCCFSHISVYNEQAVSDAFDAGRPCKVLNDRYYSQAGIFGWNKIDVGSKILTSYIPEDLKGHGADFGCGYGYLSDTVAASCPKVKSLICLDVDHRAVTACEKNMQKYDLKTGFIWADITQCDKNIQKNIRNLDFVIMNPPFHADKNVNIELGQAFIQVAHASLRRGGRLYMVANVHLPYEGLLQNTFFNVEKVHEGQGFKVFIVLK